MLKFKIKCTRFENIYSYNTHNHVHATIIPYWPLPFCVEMSSQLNIILISSCIPQILPTAPPNPIVQTLILDQTPQCALIPSTYPYQHPTLDSYVGTNLLKKV
jgi:hypothetical protein